MRIWEIKNAFIRLQNLFDRAEETEDEVERLDLQGRILDEWEKGEGALADKLEATASMLKNMTHYAEACKAEKDKFAKKQKGAENQITFMKERMIKPALLAAQKKKIVAGMHTVSLRDNKSCEIDDMSAVPEEFIKVEERRSADKREILKKLKDGERVPGTYLKESQSVQIR